MRRKVLVIGIGAGNPDHMTVEAVNALNRAAAFFIPDKGAEKRDLSALRREICERFIRSPGYRMVDFDTPDRAKPPSFYSESVAAWRAAVEAVYERLLTEELGEDEWGAFLVWGDPSLYDGTLRILDSIRARGVIALEVEVIPGISSVQALAARHRVALNGIGGSVTITTARRLAEGLPQGSDNVVVMLDGGAAFKNVAEDVDIHWGAYVGTADEILVSGRLRDVADEIERLRAAARARKGWIMDTYMLTRRDASDED
jgi:precorrin-6A synthase